MFWIILGAIAVIFTKYYTSVGSRKLHHRINTVKSDLLSAQEVLKGVRETEYDTTRDEEHDIQRVRFAKEVVHELQLRLTLANDSEPVKF